MSTFLSKGPWQLMGIQVRGTHSHSGGVCCVARDANVEANAENSLRVIGTIMKVIWGTVAILRNSWGWVRQERIQRESNT